MLLEEFDPTKKAVIDPEKTVDKIKDFPPITISVFSKTLFEEVLSLLEHKEIAYNTSCNGINPIYEITYKDHKFSFYKSYGGAPKCVGDYEEVHQMGSEALILLGNCGVLDQSIEDCGIIIPTSALRDEGTSYHYAPASDTIQVNKKYIPEFKQICEESGYPYIEGRCWTTDAFYRETRDKVNRRKAQGALCVEMECAAMQAMCDFRGIDFFQYFYAGDNLDHSDWDPRSLSGHAKLDEKVKIVFLAFELALKIAKNR